MAMRRPNTGLLLRLLQGLNMMDLAWMPFLCIFLLLDEAFRIMTSIFLFHLYSLMFSARLHRANLDGWEVLVGMHPSVDVEIAAKLRP